jgi:hypothetical protein
VSYVLRASCCAFGFWGTYCLKVRTAAGASSSRSANASGGAGIGVGIKHSSAAGNDAAEVVSLEDLSSKVAQVYQR